MQKVRCALSRYREDRNTEAKSEVRYVGGKIRGDPSPRRQSSKGSKTPRGQGAVRFFLRGNKSRRNKKNSIKVTTEGKGMDHFHKPVLQRNEMTELCFSIHPPLSTE